MDSPIPWIVGSIHLEHHGSYGSRYLQSLAIPQILWIWVSSSLGQYAHPVDMRITLHFHRSSTHGHRPCSAATSLCMQHSWYEYSGCYISPSQGPDPRMMTYPRSMDLRYHPDPMDRGIWVSTDPVDPMDDPLCTHPVIQDMHHLHTTYITWLWALCYVCIAGYCLLLTRTPQGPQEQQQHHPGSRPCMLAYPRSRGSEVSRYLGISGSGQISGYPISGLQTQDPWIPGSWVLEHSSCG